jgi:hypothetical protein
LVRVFPQTPADIEDPEHAKLLSGPKKDQLSFETFVKLIKPQTHLTAHTAVNEIRIHFRCGHLLSLAVTDEEQERLDCVLPNLPRRSDFVVIDALDHVVAVNPNKVTRIQQLLENSGHDTPSKYLVDEAWVPLPDDGVAWLPTHESTMTVIDVEPDFVPMGLESEEPPLFVKFYDLESAEDCRMFSFDDIDGETEYINTDDIAVVAIHRMYLADYWDIWNEDEDTASPSTVRRTSIQKNG